MADSASKTGVASGLLSRLKSETSLQHEALERDLRLLERPVSSERYRALLMRFYGFYHPWESLFHPVVEGWRSGATAARSKVSFLADDLKYLGCDPDTIELVRLRPPDSLASALGSMYVLEGSTLGGQIISRHLAEALQLSTVAGRRFFFSYGKNVGPMWRHFTALLLEYSSPAHDDEIVESARGTFSALHAWLCKTC